MFPSLCFVWKFIYMYEEDNAVILRGFCVLNVPLKTFLC